MKNVKANTYGILYCVAFAGYLYVREWASRRRSEEENERLTECVRLLTEQLDSVNKSIRDRTGS